VKAYRIGAIIWTVVGLGVNAFIHFSLAPSLDSLGAGSLASIGTLFRIEAIANVVVGLLVLFVHRAWTGILAAIVAGAGLALLIGSTLGTIALPFGLPEIPMAGWSTQKLVSAVSQAIAIVSGIAIAATARRRRG
jgi:hypothetical protein